MLKIKEKDLNKIILIGDRILIRPSKPKNRTDSGLYLPQGLHKKEELYSGYVLKVGPGYPIPAVTETDEIWKEEREEVKYVPLQPHPGDLAVYMQKSIWEIEFNKQNLIIAPHSALLMLIREDD
jgi:co-chaperonin GroES (HSP10)